MRDLFILIFAICIIVSTISSCVEAELNRITQEIYQPHHK